MKKYVLFLFILLGASTVLQGQAERKYIRQGNKEYKSEKYDESEILYRRALEKDRESYSGEFNLGDALYKQEKYEDAVRNFEKLAEDEQDPVKLGYLYHNMGNSLLQSNRLEESIEAYKNALRNNPLDDETRHNLAYALSLLQQQQQQQQQQSQDQQQQDQQQDQEQQDQQQQDQQQQDQQEISKEDAERMLQALQQDEQKLQEELQKQKANARRVRVLKDW